MHIKNTRNPQLQRQELSASYAWVLGLVGRNCLNHDALKETPSRSSESSRFLLSSCFQIYVCCDFRVPGVGIWDIRVMLGFGVVENQEKLYLIQILLRARPGDRFG